MKTVDALHTRYSLLKNMVLQSRRGANWGRNGLARGRMPVEVRTEVSELEAYLDAHETGRGIHKWLHYLPIYERHLQQFKGREVHVLEIGVYSGGSLDMWRQYLGPQSHIYGLDIREACRSYESPGIKIFIGDQADPAYWRQFIREVPELDVVIDDGGHRSPEQIATLEALLPHLRPGGVYICEDIVNEYNPYLDYLFGLSRDLHTYPHGTKPSNGMALTSFQQAIDSFHFYPMVSVIEKRGDRLDRMICPRRGSEWQPQSFWDEKPGGLVNRGLV